LSFWRRIPAFVWGDVASALIAGATVGAFVDSSALQIFPAVMVGNVATGLLVCWWAFGFAAAGWKLWLTATVINPLLIFGVVWTIQDYDCLFSGKTGWSCMLDEVGPFIAGISLVPPLIGLVCHWLTRAIRKDAQPIH
jgi:hypothetical protein